MLLRPDKNKGAIRVVTVAYLFVYLTYVFSMFSVQVSFDAAGAPEIAEVKGLMKYAKKSLAKVTPRIINNLVVGSAEAAQEGSGQEKAMAIPLSKKRAVLQGAKKDVPVQGCKLAAFTPEAAPRAMLLLVEHDSSAGVIEGYGYGPGGLSPPIWAVCVSPVSFSTPLSDCLSYFAEKHSYESPGRNYAAQGAPWGP